MSEPPPLEPLPEHLADYEWAQAVSAGEAEARQRFTREYGEKILQTVYIWCKPFCNRGCHLRRAGIRKLMEHFLRQECDQILGAYTYLLDQLENLVLKRYRGQAALSSFLLSVLHPDGAFFNRYRIEFVRSEKGKVVLPVWAEGLSAGDRGVLKELMFGTEVEDIAIRLSLTLEEAQAAVGRLRDAAIKGGWGAYWRHFTRVHVRETQMPVLLGDEDGESQVPFDPPDTTSPSPDAAAVFISEKARLQKALARLSAQERVILKLRFVEEKSVAEVARALDTTDAQIRYKERTSMEWLRKFFSGDDSLNNG